MDLVLLPAVVRYLSKDFAMIKLLLSLLIVASSASAMAESLFDKTVDGNSLLKTVTDQGVPAEAVKTLFEYLDANSGKTFTVDHQYRGKSFYFGKRKVRMHEGYAAIIDFSQPSSEERLYLINLNTGSVEKSYVSHGRNTGVVVASQFSNIDNSKMSSLGMVMAGDIYTGKYGQSMNLYGMESSNDLMAKRAIVMHPAPYADPNYIDKRGRLGRSWGCFALPPELAPKIIHALLNGGVIYSYHPALMQLAKDQPTQQTLQDAPKDAPFIDFPDEEEGLSGGPMVTADPN